MIWTRHGEMGMIAEPYRVGMFFLDGCTLYGLWCGDEKLGYFDCFEDAQTEAERHARGGEEQRDQT